MRFDKIRLSSRATHAFGMLKISTGLEPTVLSRFALCLSVSQEGIPNPDEYNKGGSELAPDALFGEHRQVYLALMINRLRRDGLDEEHYLNEMVRCHINRGAIGLKQRIKTLSDFAGLARGHA